MDSEDRNFHKGLDAYSDEERQRIALMDEADVRAAVDGLVLIAGAEGICVPGGKHVETGIAVALARPVFVIGRRENIFHWHPLVRVFSSASAFLDFLDAPNASSHTAVVRTPQSG